MRNTRQRRIILDQLRGLTSHPTADDLYSMLRSQMPKISLGTVYRNLEILSQEGMIQKLEMGGSQKRFDGNAANHYHIRCQQCGRVDDLALHPSQELEAEAERLSDWTVMRHRLEFVGLCPACREKAAK